MAKRDKEGNWIDSRGKSVPVEYISKMDKEQDKICEFAFTRINKLEKMMMKYKAEIQEKIDAYNEWFIQEHGLEKLGKGNQTLNTFNGDKALEVRMNSIFVVNDRIHAFEEKMEAWLNSELSGATKKIRTIVRHYMKRDNKNNYSVKSLQELKSLEIPGDKGWSELMELLGKCISVRGTKMYLRPKRRETEMEELRTIDLSFSSI